MITRDSANGYLDEIRGIGDHRPEWMVDDCPSCGSEPCSHPDVLACKECCDDWPCQVVAEVAVELEWLVKELDQLAVRAGSQSPWRDGQRHGLEQAGNVLHRRAAKLRGDAG